LVAARNSNGTGKYTVEQTMTVNKAGKYKLHNKQQSGDDNCNITIKLSTATKATARVLQNRNDGIRSSCWLPSMGKAK